MICGVHIQRCRNCYCSVQRLNSKTFSTIHELPLLCKDFPANTWALFCLQKVHSLFPKMLNKKSVSKLVNLSNQYSSVSASPTFFLGLNQQQVMLQRQDRCFRLNSHHWKLQRHETPGKHMYTYSGKEKGFTRKKKKFLDIKHSEGLKCAPEKTAFLCGPKRKTTLNMQHNTI